MAVAQISASLTFSVRDVLTISHCSSPSRLPFPSSFATGSPLVLRRTTCQAKATSKAIPFSVKCEQSTQGSNGLDVWLGRLAMVGFTVAISVEVATGKGLLENFGLSGPLPIAALAVTGLAGTLTAFFIFQSAAKN